MLKKTAEFARSHIAPMDTLGKADTFPTEIWDKMGNEKILGIGIPEEFGGTGGGFSAISEAGKILTENGNCLGLTLSMFIHQLVAFNFISGFGNESQKSTYLPRLATGETTACLAVSEPEAGAHPKKIRTTAEYQNGSYMINGEKAYLTNGPMAGLFIVIAVTSQENGRNRFTAFLVPRDTKGLTVKEPLQIPFFKPSPHGGILLENCEVSGSNILGTTGSAYEDMVLPFRSIEDALMTGPVAGAFNSLLKMLADALKKSGTEPDDALCEKLGRLRSMADTANLIAREASGIIDRSKPSDADTLTIFFRSLGRDFQTLIQDIIETAAIKTTPAFRTLLNDLVMSARIASGSSTAKQKKIGRHFFIVQ